MRIAIVNDMLLAVEAIRRLLTRPGGQAAQTMGLRSLANGTRLAFRTSDDVVWTLGLELFRTTHGFPRGRGKLRPWRARSPVFISIRVGRPCGQV